MLPGAPAVLAQHSSANGAAPGPFAGAEVPLLHEPSDNSAESRNAASPVIGNGEPGVTSVACEASAGVASANQSAKTCAIRLIVASL